MKYAIILLSCVMVVVALFFILRWFFKRMKKIEEDKWGKKA